MNGILLIDKPQGLTSHDVVARVRRTLRIRRVGHTGTLDPMATGVLPVAVGQGTRLVQFLMEGRKTYRATLKLGETTDTQDAEGQLIERRCADHLEPGVVAEIFSRFVGEIVQLPPMYSAIKKDGVPLYRLARQGVEVEREGRRTRIDRIDILQMALPLVSFEVTCAKGTYIRTLAHDIGQALGVGAHLTRLCRTETAGFSLPECIGLDQLEPDARPGVTPGFLPLAAALRSFQQVAVDEQAASRLADGIPPLEEQVAGEIRCHEGHTVALVRHQRLLAVARYAPGRVREKRGDFELLRVFHPADEA